MSMGRRFRVADGKIPRSPMPESRDIRHAIAGGALIARSAPQRSQA